MIIAFLCVIGAAIAVGLLTLIYRLIQKISDDMDDREKKAKTILSDRDLYLKKQMFEELVYIEKYKKELEQGKWPREMEEKFEYNEPESDVYVLEETETGTFIKPKKRWLRLKDCFKKKQGDNKPKDDRKEVKKKDNDNNKQ
ncbi:MAG: hypothetical protein IIT37_10860 [Bacteroidales bacterium]|nr:hypothetical protein [Bacteroidales bacterium]